MLGTLEEAQEVLQELADGAPFHQLANERSLHRDTGKKGGDSGGYKLRDQVTPALAGALFELEVGERENPSLGQLAGGDAAAEGLEHIAVRSPAVCGACHLLIFRRR